MQLDHNKLLAAQKSRLQKFRPQKQADIPVVDEVATNRRFEYPSMGEQFDMLYHDIESGKFGAKAKDSSFFKQLKAVKEKYPKP